ncbi:MAG TPA: GerMN domain-containing protein [Anaerolineaceae bacterium]|nr:GerMN domain-containing protein [Anaerolineaceae bacterium]
MKRILFPVLLVVSALALMACSVSFDLFGNNAEPTLITPPTNPPAVATPTLVPEPTVIIALPSPEVIEQEITVFFLDENRFVAAIEPYEVALTRTTTNNDLPLAVLEAYFAGPTADEYNQGLRMHGSGFTHVRALSIENGIARVFLGGECANNGAAYSVAALIMKNLEQFPEITAIKIYDENDSTLDPDSPNSSLPYCLEP